MLGEIEAEFLFTVIKIGKSKYISCNRCLNVADSDKQYGIDRLALEQMSEKL